MIKLSVAAAQEVARIKRSQDKLDSALRLRIKQGGCSGLFYCLELESGLTPEKSSIEGVTLSDRSFESQGVVVLVDEQSYTHLEGMQIDYAEDLMGGGFRFQNPQAANSCSCGISFTLQ